jgi:hypothetical protein
MFKDTQKSELLKQKVLKISNAARVGGARNCGGIGLRDCSSCFWKSL